MLNFPSKTSKVPLSVNFCPDLYIFDINVSSLTFINHFKIKVILKLYFREIIFEVSEKLVKSPIFLILFKT